MHVRSRAEVETVDKRMT